MAMIEARPVNPLDGRWEYSPTQYRVYFWRLTTGQIAPGRPVIWGSDEYELKGAADVAEVLEWANSNAEGRDFTAYAVIDRGSDKGLVHVFGIDPTRPRSLT
jgi:hypothetical protein